MTFREVRAQASAAIRAIAPDTEIIRVFEVDTVSASDIPVMADGLGDASISSAGDRGPAICAVMAEGRQEHQGFDLTVYTVVRSRLELKLVQSGRGRGIAVVDLVEQALQELPGSGLPRLLVRTTAAEITASARKVDPTVRVFISRCTWPSAFPATPLETSIGSSSSAIRAHFAAIIARMLPAANEAQIGATESAWRWARIAGMVPRARILLRTQRETIGGAPDFVVREDVTWQDSEPIPRTWAAQGVTQTVIVITEVAHRKEDLADEAALRIAAQVEGEPVVWPGDFDARVPQEDGTMATERLPGGTYEQDVRLMMFERAEWDSELGLAVARVMAGVEAVDPITVATLRGQFSTVEKTAQMVVPIGMVRVRVGRTYAIIPARHGMAAPLTVASDDDSVATATADGSTVTVAGIGHGETTIEIVGRMDARRTVRVQVRN